MFLRYNGTSSLPLIFCWKIFLNSLLNLTSSVTIKFYVSASQLLFGFRDVTYFPSSGSIIAVAGYSTNNINVIIWDTLAPPTTSQATILCHEGFALNFVLLNFDVCLRFI